MKNFETPEPETAQQTSSAVPPQTSDMHGGSLCKTSIMQLFLIIGNEVADGSFGTQNRVEEFHYC